MIYLSFSAIYLIFAILFSLSISIYAWRNPQGRAAKPFAVAAFSSVVWMLGELVERLGQSFAVQWAGQGICFIGVCFLPVTMLVFILEYCGRPLSRRQIVLLSIIPSISWLVMITNPFHFLFYSKIEMVPFEAAQPEYGIYFNLIHMPYCYILSLIGYAAVILERQKAPPHYRPQITLLFFALCIPLTINALGLANLLGRAAYTAFSFPFFFSIVAVAVYRYRFLKSNPIAYETVFRTIRDGVIVLDLENIITDINPAAAKSLWGAPRNIIGKNVEEVFAPWEDLIARYKDAPASLDLRDEIKLNLGGKERFIAVNITPLENRRGTLDGRIVTLSDVTDRKHYELSLETMAFYDPLTRLANRRKFLEEVSGVLAQSSRETNKKLAVLYFDLNGFKKVNDTIGHAAGDELLKYVGNRVSSVLRAPNMIARLGGDEFAVLLHNCDQYNVRQVVDRILEAVQRPFKVGTHTLTAKLSIGASFYPEHGTTVDDLLERADEAMYHAKRGGGGLALFESNVLEMTR